jgi:DNA-nicking Smr family endonuclease
MAARRGRPPLDPADRALWDAVAATVTPLRRRRRRAAAEAPPPAPPAQVPAEVPAPPPAAAEAPATPAPAKAVAKSTPPPPPSPAAVDRRTRQRIARGQLAVEARIDLHGMTQERAHRALVGFLRASRGDGLKTVLVITGKGRPGDAERGAEFERGVLRRMVPAWLEAPDAAVMVESYGEAARPHGGGGALYVRLRRPGRGGA